MGIKADDHDSRSAADDDVRFVRGDASALSSSPPATSRVDRIARRVVVLERIFALASQRISVLEQENSRLLDYSDWARGKCKRLHDWIQLVDDRVANWDAEVARFESNGLQGSEDELELSHALDASLRSQLESPDQVGSSPSGSAPQFGGQTHSPQGLDGGRGTEAMTAGVEGGHLHYAP